jgi:hypothetical protein
VKTISNVANTTVVSIIIVAVGYFALSRGVLIGPVIFLLGLVPLAGARLNRLELKRLIPDIVFGTLDTGLLMIAALAGAQSFGVLGAIVGSAIGDAVTDGIAGFFEGSIAEWLRERGIEEARTELGSALGKMSGCLLGSGFVLTVALLLGIQGRPMIKG